MNEQEILLAIEELRRRILSLEIPRNASSDCNDPGVDPHQCSTCATGAQGPGADDQGQLVRSRGSLPGLLVRSTIDGTRSDNSFLGCTYSAYSRAGYNPSTHWTTAQAFSNLRGGPADVSIIVGHGSSGVIVTGTGQVIDGADKYMSTANESSWRQYASQGVPGSRLVLFGCEVAAGAAGATFLSHVAKLVRKEVGAWTGLVYCSGGTTVWGTGDFVVARPGRALKPIEAPDMFEFTKEMHTLHVQSAEGHEEVKLSSIKRVNFTPIGSAPLAGTAATLEGKEAQELLQFIDFANPFVTEDKPGAILVGLLSITYETKAKTEETRAFRVLAYSLLQDVCFPTTYYYISKQLRNKLLSD
jgi:hypothetical protein